MARGKGSPHGGNMAGEKAKDFKGTVQKLFRYMSAFKVHMFFVAVFAICGTVFNIVGPKILGKRLQRFLTDWKAKFRAAAALISGRAKGTF